MFLLFAHLPIILSCPSKIKAFPPLPLPHLFVCLDKDVFWLACFVSTIKFAFSPFFHLPPPPFGRLTSPCLWLREICGEGGRGDLPVWRWIVNMWLDT
jgi:hypothetical protein